MTGIQGDYMATHSSVLAWRLPGTEEPDGLLSMGSHRVGHDWSNLAAAAAADGIITFSIMSQDDTKFYLSIQFSLVQSLSHVWLCDPMNCSMPGLPVHHQLPEFTQTHVHRVSDAIQPCHPLSSPSPSALNPSQHHSICQQIWKTQQWSQDWKRSVFIPIPKKGNAKACSNYCTIAVISHASKVMLKILQARLQQYVNHELPDVQAGFRKGRGIQRSNCQHPLYHQKNQRVPKKHLFLLYWLCQSLWLCGSQ